jgi:hypothetical protein
VASLIEEDVFRFQISIDNVLGVQVLECQNYFCCIKTCDIVGEPSFPPKMCENLSSNDVFHHQIQIHFVMKRSIPEFGGKSAQLGEREGGGRREESRLWAEAGTKEECA